MFDEQIIRYRGDTYADSITVKQSGVAVDITGYSFILSVANSENPSTASYQYQITGTITDASGGVVEFAPNTSQADQRHQTHPTCLLYTSDAADE